MGLGIRLKIVAALGTVLAVAALPLVPILARGTAASQSSADSLIQRGLGLYLTLVGALIVVALYLAMTLLIVRPLERVAQAASRVASGGRRLLLPEVTTREFADLGDSLRAMTEALAAEEAKLRDKLAELERAQQQIIAAERLASVGRLSAGLVHEIGNPLAAIVGLQELALDPRSSEPEKRDYLERMRSETVRIQSTLRGLLAFARPGLPSTEGAAAAASDVPDAVRDTLALVTPQRDFRTIRIETDFPGACPNARISAQALRQVILNLLLNARDAVGDRDGAIAIRIEPKERFVRLSVEDNGGGFLPEIMPRLFEPFATTKEVGQGSGLGLAVCRGLVEAEGGRIRADTSPSLGGARVTVELRVAGGEGGEDLASNSGLVAS